VTIGIFGKWLEQNGEAVYGDLDSGLGWGATCCGGFSYKRNICYFWCRSWPGTEIPIGCFTTELKSATLLATGQPLDFEQREYRIILKNLPAVSPDKIAGYTIIALEFASPPEAKLYATTAPMLMALKG
jgi:hypothetical protein